MKSPPKAVVFQVEVGGKFAALCVFDSDVHTLANSLKEVLLSVDEEVPETEQEDSTLGHKRASGSVEPETAAEKTAIHKH